MRLGATRQGREIECERERNGEIRRSKEREKRDRGRNQEKKVREIKRNRG